MLDLGGHDAARLLVEALVVPARVEPFQDADDAVVLAHPNRVHRGQLRLFVNSAVACGNGTSRSSSTVHLLQLHGIADLLGSRRFGVGRRRTPRR